MNSSKINNMKDKLLVIIITLYNNLQEIVCKNKLMYMEIVFLI